MSNLGPRCAWCALLTVSMISAGLLMSGCASQQSAGTSNEIVRSTGPIGTTNLDEASGKAGDPLIVVSNVAVEVARYSSMVSKDGARTGRKDIVGWAVMPRDVYFSLVDARKRAEIAVSKAEERNQIVDILANKCRDDSVCFAAAKPHIARVIGAAK